MKLRFKRKINTLMKLPSFDLYFCAQPASESVRQRKKVTERAMQIEFEQKPAYLVFPTSKVALLSYKLSESRSWTIISR